ncbi:unnamed protein product [Natator depressus]|uniref:arf-GAP domain and FG repeat-containing protein 2 n=1 Tax=Natator depressus TaxID=27790 RepID=UPI003D52B631
MAAGAGGRKPGAPRDAESEVWSRRVRDLVGSGPGNRLCFECGQRGVTYVDITLGSFVCTGCSGALRGLNPPHRVKSISMTTFTESEVLFLQSRGNEACRKVWLGSFDPRTSLLPDSRDPQKVKEFLQEKYEKKRCLFGSLSQPAVLPPSGPAPAYGAYTNPFAPPARPSTNPFQPNGTAPGSSFDGFTAAQVGQPVGISTNPFMTAAPSPPFVIKHPATNPFL